jgi:hypothetical protein
MRYALSVLTLSASLFLSLAVEAQSQGTFRYPKVYGPTGSLYGPTQAHYQYQRQYGRPWHGYGGLTANVGRGYSPQYSSHGHGHRHYSYSTYGNGYSSYGGYGYGRFAGNSGYFDRRPVYSYIPMAPIVLQGHPQFIGPSPFNNSVLHNAQIENEKRWGKQLIIEPQPKTVERKIKESTPAAQLKSLRAQSQGDEWFRKGNYLQAYARYKVAVTEADDRAVAHFRLAYCLVAMGRYDRAVAEMKRGLRIDPTWPVTGESLLLVFGADNLLAKTSTVSRVTAWVREDIRDPDRLFLIGVLMHFDDDDRAGKFFETAIRLTGGGNHLVAFLKQPPTAEGPQQPVPQVQPVPPKPAIVPKKPEGPLLPPVPSP